MVDDGAACLLVSHDRTFVNTIGTCFLLIRDRKLVVPAAANALRLRNGAAF